MRKRAFFIVQLFVFCQLHGQQVNADDHHIAAASFDLVSYHTAEGPKKGKKQHAVIHEGYRYFFNSAKNKARFESSPNHYLPAFGGWCAYAMAKGDKVTVNPLAYTIENGQLYLFYKNIITDTRSKWLKNNIALKKSAEKQWALLVDSKQ